MSEHRERWSAGSWFAWPLLWVALVGIVGCESLRLPGVSEKPEPLSPTLWVAQGPGGAELHLLGSIHLGRPDGLDLGPRVDTAFRESDELVVEVDLSALGQKELVQATQRYGVIQPPEDLRSRISDDTWGLLADYLARRGQPIEAYNRLTPWLVATTIAVMEFQAMGFEPEAGVDQVFVDKASGGDKPVVGLETLDGQFRLLAGLPASVQEMMLRDMLVRSSDFRDEAMGMIDAWEKGDDAELERLIYRSLELDPSLQVFYDRVFFERNRRMADRLVELSGDGKARFVVIGAGHMLGVRGVPALLEARGFQVSRVE